MKDTIKVILIVLAFLFVLDTVEARPSHYAVKSIYMKILRANNIKFIPRLDIKHTEKEIAYSTAFRIVISTGFIASTHNIHELALVLGHEIAHIRLYHPESNHRNEYEADRLGANYVKHAGYNACLGAKLLLRFGDEDSESHPSGYKRYQRLCGR